MRTMEDIGKKIHKRRIELKMSLEDVGQAVGVSKSTVLRWEKGDIRSMGVEKVPALARVLNMNPAELVPGLDMEFSEIRRPIHPDALSGLDSRIIGREMYATDAAPDSLEHDLETLLRAWKDSSPKMKKAIIRVIKAMEEEEE